MHVFIPVHFHAPLGGLQAHVIAQLRAVHRAGGKVTVLAPSGPFADMVLAEGAHFVTSSDAPVHAEAQRAIAEAREPFDLVHAHPFRARQVGLEVARHVGVPFLLTLSLFKDDSGKPYSIATIAKDISSLKKVESKLVEYKNHLEDKVALRTRELEETNKRLREVRAQISKYIDPTVTEKIFKGDFEAELGHQRKKLTVFFSDINDFRQFTDASYPEDVAKLLNEY